MRYEYDTIEVLNMDSKAEYSALSSTRRLARKKETKTSRRQCPFSNRSVLLSFWTSLLQRRTSYRVSFNDYADDVALIATIRIRPGRCRQYFMTANDANPLT